MPLLALFVARAMTWDRDGHDMVKRQLSMTHVFIPFKKQSSALVASQHDQNKQRLPEQIGRCTGLGEGRGTRSVSRPQSEPPKN